MGIAQAVARRGDCTRRQVGAVILSPEHRVVGLGFNGTRPGDEGCLDGACPRGRHYRQSCQNPQHFHSKAGKFACIDFDTCACGNSWPCPESVEPGSSYDTGPGTCINTHAEQNAQADAQQRGGGRLAGCVMYVSEKPCDGCLRQIRNQTDIISVYWTGGEKQLGVQNSDNFAADTGAVRNRSSDIPAERCCQPEESCERCR